VAIFPAVYRGQAVSINGSTIKALVPQVFGDTPVTVRDFLGVMPTSRTDGWIFFQGGNPSYPVWGGNLAVGGTGPPGPPGPTGPPGTSVMQRGYRFDNRTTASDPGSGVLRLNTVDPTTTTQIYLSVYERDGSIVPGIAALASGDSFWLYESSNINSSVQYNVTGASVVSSDGQWATVPVSSVQNKGFTPTNNQNIEVYLSIEPAADYATTTYVDNRIDGVSWKTPCDVATTTNIALTGSQTIDGVNVGAAGIIRILVKNQTNAAENGIYINNTNPWQRDSDFDINGHVQGAVVFVQQGTTNHDTIWYVSAPDTWPTLGTTPIVWTQFQGGSGGSGGTTILNGSGPPASTLGAVGNYYEDTFNGVFYGPKQTPTNTGAANAILNEPFNDFTTNNWAATIATITPSGRTGSGVQTTAAGSSVNWTIPAGSESDYVIVGFAFNATGSTADRTVVQLCSDAGATLHLNMQIGADGSIVVFRGASLALLLSIPPTAAVPGTWAYIEIQARLHDTAGTVTVRVNGTQVGTVTNQDTKNAGTKATFDTVKLRGSNGLTEVYDDLYVKTGSGASFAGDIAIGASQAVWPLAVNEVYIGTDDPTTLSPTLRGPELWYDSDDDPAATDRANFWNSAWGMVARQDYGDNITLNAAGQVVAALTFNAVPGRQYRVHLYCPLIVNAGSNISFDIYSNGTQLSVGGGWLASGASYDARYLTWPLWRAGSFSGTQALQIKVGSYNSTAMNFYREALWVEDLGPITKAAVNPPDGQPQIATAGNALGIVAMGAFTTTASINLPANTYTQVTQTLPFTMLTGRRYRIHFLVRAQNITATNASNLAAGIFLRDGTTSYPDSSGPWFVALATTGLYQAINYHWVFNGDGVARNFNVALNPQLTAVTVYPDQQSFFYIEDVGPNQAPALPIPNTPQGWTPITAFTNGWQNFDTTRTAQYRKIGDEVTMRGVLKGGTVGYGTPMFNLPTGFRPPTGRDEDWVVRAAGAPANLTVFANGNVSVTDNASGASATYVYLNGVRWSVTA